MTTQQGLRHAVFRSIGGTTGTYNGDLYAAFLVDGATDATFNGAFIEWLQIKLVSTDTEINGLMNEYAASKGASSWSQLGTFTP